MRPAVAAMALLAGCHGPRHQYLEAYWDRTERLEVFRELGTALLLQATYLSPEYRAAMAGERERLIGPAADDHEAFEGRLLDDAEAYHEVVFTAESSLEGSNMRFGPNDEGWHVRLTADGTEQSLVTVYRIEEPTMLHRALFDGFGRYNQLWIAKFANTVADPAEVVFHVGSGFGHGEVRWTGEQLR